MITKHRGGILNQFVGWLSPIPGSAVYAATKAYVTSFPKRPEPSLRETDVSVCAVCPGPVVTNSSKWPGARMLRQRSSEVPRCGEEQVVRDALAAFEADRLAT